MTDQKPKRKPGRPSSLTPEREERLLKLVSSGKTIGEACRALRISRQAITDKRYVDDEFHKRSARATLLGTEANIEMCEERLRHSTNRRISVDRELAHHYRWKASKLLSAYKDRIGVDLGIEANVHVEDALLSEIENAKRLIFTLRVGEEALRNLGCDELAKLMAVLRPQLALPAPIEGTASPVNGQDDQC